MGQGLNQVVVETYLLGDFCERQMTKQTDTHSQDEVGGKATVTSKPTDNLEKP